MSTHILPEVEQICEQVIIISKGKVVAKDTVDNLTNRLRGSESIGVTVEPRNGPIPAGAVQQRLEQVAGVSRVIQRDARETRQSFELEGLQGRSIRGDVARAIVDSGWDLTELKPVALSLEEVFLQLTGTEPATEQTHE